ncbi:MAG: hypothetical protein A2Z72_02955 [Omnitrophica bacterium RBG_13_46_9]|nr:MAG: hypothetical protein A2Z72_02955 [Omnitrophica bacterium RBG_13_46_9]
MPKVSVIIPTYNCGEYLDESISSVLGQTYRDLELIVVDNGSDDDSDRVVGRHAGDQRLIYVKKATKNVSRARNFGISSANGELLAFLDADDMFFKDKISRQVDLFEKNPRCGLSYTNEVYFKKGEAGESLSTYYHFSGDIFYYLKRNNFIHTSTVMGRKSIFLENMFDETLNGHEDWELFLRIARKGIRFLYLDEPLSKVRLREKSVTRNKSLMDATRREVGLRARGYWRDFKKEARPFSLRGQEAMLRYLKFKAYAFLLGFPKKRCFNMPIPQETPQR